MPSNNLSDFIIPEFSTPTEEEQNALHWIYDLSQTEWAIATQLAMGYTIAQIAQKTDRSRRTIESHVSSIVDKLNLPNRSSIIRFMLLLKPTPNGFS